MLALVEIEKYLFLWIRGLGSGILTIQEGKIFKIKWYKKLTI